MEDNNWSKNKILMFVLYWVICCFCIWIFVVSTLANDSGWLTGTYSNDCGSYSDINPQSCIATYEQYNSSFNYSDYNYWYKYEPASNRMILYFVPKDYVLVRTESNGAYYWYAYSYDGTNLVSQKFKYEIYMRIGDSTARLQDYGSRVSGIDENIADFSGPYATSTSYALKYFQTMDSSFLENGDSVVIPEPQNVSCYFASGENAYYIYWEAYLNDFKYKDNFSLDTVMNVSEGFYDLSNDFIVENSYVIVNALNYKTVRYQCKIDVSFFENVETAGLCIEIFNRGTSLNTFKEYYSSSYELFINKDSEYYELAKKNDDFSTVYPVVDYVNGNSNYTGGNMPELELPEFDSSDVGGIGFLDNIFNGFGLLGDNGLLALIGSMFSFIPTPIFVGLSTFVFVAILIALFKMFVK